MSGYSTILLLRQSEDYQHSDGNTYCLMGEPGEYDLFLLDEEEDEWNEVDFIGSSLSEITEYTKLMKTILDTDKWCPVTE